jgi:hypothetical protein
MSDFSNKLNSCMSSKGLPPPNLETLNDVMEMLHLLEAAREEGAEADVVIGNLLGPLAVELKDDALQALSAAATVAVTFYINSCISCLGVVAFQDLKDYVASNAPTDDYLRGQLISIGVPVDAAGTAVA